MPKVEFDIREHGGLFALVEHFDKAQEFIHLAADLFISTTGFTDVQPNIRVTYREVAVNGL
jgi:hypothetical protein